MFGFTRRKRTRSFTYKGGFCFGECQHRIHVVRMEMDTSAVGHALGAVRRIDDALMER